MSEGLNEMCCTCVRQSFNLFYHMQTHVYLLYLLSYSSNVYDVLLHAHTCRFLLFHLFHYSSFNLIYAYVKYVALYVLIYVRVLYTFTTASCK